MFQLNQQFASLYLASGVGQSQLKEAAEACKPLAEAFSPVDSGDYVSGFIVTEDDAKVYLGNKDWKAWWIEMGTEAPGPTPVFAPLRRAVEAAGYQLGPPSSEQAVQFDLDG